MAVFGAVFLGLLTLAATAGAVWQAVTGSGGTAAALAGVAVHLGHVTGLGVRAITSGTRRTGTTGVTSGSEGLTFRYSTAATYWLAATTALTALVLACLVVPAVAQGGAEGYLIAAVLAVAAVPAGVFLVVVLRLAPGRVVIGPDGIHHRGLTFTHDVPWHAVVDVVAAWANGPVVVIRAMPSADTATRDHLGRSAGGRPSSSFTTVTGTWLTADPALLLHAVAHYLIHPEDRPELGTPAALHRIASRPAGRTLADGRRAEP